MKHKIDTIIKHLALQPHVEGGYFKRTYQSSIEFNFKDRCRAINSAIYYLLKSDDFSCWHKLKSDEIWHHYCGSNVIIYQINIDGTLSSIKLGNLLDDPQAQPQYLIPADTWFSAEVEIADSFALVGCTVAPGFEFEDFEMGNRANLIKEYPQHKEIIMRFTRK